MKTKVLIILSVISLNLFAGISDDFKFANKLFEDGLYDEAIDIYSRIVDVSPTSLEAEKSLYFIGESYLKQNKFEKAESVFKRLWKGYTNSPDIDKALFKYAFSIFKQENYNDSKELFSRLIITYPRNDITQEALIPYLECLYQLQDYAKLIQEANNFLHQYENSFYKPDIKIVLAKALFATGSTEEAEKKLKEIISNHKNENIRWKAELVRLNIFEQTKGKTQVIIEYENLATESIPRIYEETFLFNLANLYYETQKYQKADNTLDILINKYSQSPNLDKYIILKQTVAITLKNYDYLTDSYENNKKIFKGRTLRNRFLINVAKGFYFKKQTTIAKEILAQIKTKDADEAFDAEFLKASIAFSDAQFTSSVNFIQNAISSYPSAKNKFKALIFAGDIYLNNLLNIDKSLELYKSALVMNPEYEDFTNIILKITECYDRKKDFSSSMEYISQVDLRQVNDESLKMKIINKKELYNKYLIKDYETGFNRLLSALNNYLDTDNKDYLKDEIIKITASDLKDYDEAIKMFDVNKNPELASDIYLQLAKKSQLEGDAEKLSSIMEKIDELISATQENGALHDRLIIEKALLENNKITEDLYKKMVNYITFYDEPLSENKFRIILGNYDKDNEEKYLEWMDALVYIDGMNKDEYYNAKLNLGEYYFQKSNFEKALKNYQEAIPLITIYNPSVYYNYTICLLQTDRKQEAIKQLEFLLNNANSLPNKRDVVFKLADLYREYNLYEMAVQTMEKLELNHRDDEFYNQLYFDYVKLNQTENAQKALLYIQNKNDEQLELLADSYINTKNYEMAIFTYEQILNRNKDKKKRLTLKIAHTYFLMEDYKHCADNYAKIFDTLSSIKEDFVSVEDRSVEYIISLYRIKNRPKAESVIKTQKKQIASNYAQSRIKLANAVYLIESDPDKSIKILNKLLKKEKNNLLKIKETFWRGVAYLKIKNLDKAEADFKAVLASDNIEMKNHANLKLGTINFSKENYETALDYYYQVIQSDSSGTLALDATKNFAFVCKTIKEWQKAISAYEIILERWGDKELKSETIFDIAFCYYRDKRYNKSIEMFSNALSLLKDSAMKAEAQYWIGESYFGLEDYDNAVTAFLKVSYDYPKEVRWVSVSELQASEAYIKLHKYEKAQRLLENMIRKYGKDSNWGKQAQEKLRLIR